MTKETIKVEQFTGKIQTAKNAAVLNACFLDLLFKMLAFEGIDISRRTTNK